MIHLKTLNKKQLEAFVSSGDYKKYGFLPITEHRAVSHIKNPKANEDQTLLILAFDRDQLAGYLGCFPDQFVTDGKTFSYAWLSTLFISNEFRGKRIAQSLLNKAFEEYHGNIAITEFTKEAEGLYNKMGVFEYIQPKQGKRYYFRTDLKHIISAKKPELKSLQPVFRLADSVANILISVKNTFVKKPEFKFEVLDKIDQESKAFLSKFKSNRNAEEINGLINHPWVLEGKLKEEKYLFSSYSEQFLYFWIKIFNEDNVLVTCSLLLLRDGHLKIPYFFSKAEPNQLIDFLGYFILKNKVITLTSYQTDINSRIENSKKFPAIHKRNLERRYMFHKDLIAHLPESFDPGFQDGDGDCAMT
ncbi:GNAT family N-acetyltransferase [Chryseobacterium sp. SN22]|uniref:GNAT family N-acetyltransferase n=1 Tax=Chryseobacterium sp. SN22 TaxID=2606431 RepID=UPI0011EE90D2|nr:GNAT family N-acetyltransferase [Chryseobacterium sp. SN22]KAA0127790.1 GNAT family N-acetyltransferase [Chryseobacterium sp. SN22]